MDREQMQDKIDELLVEIFRLSLKINRTGEDEYCDFTHGGGELGVELFVMGYHEWRHKYCANITIDTADENCILEIEDVKAYLEGVLKDE